MFVDGNICILSCPVGKRLLACLILLKPRNSTPPSASPLQLLAPPPPPFVHFVCLFFCLFKSTKPFQAGPEDRGARVSASHAVLRQSSGEITRKGGRAKESETKRARESERQTERANGERGGGRDAESESYEFGMATCAMCLC